MAGCRAAGVLEIVKSKNRPQGKGRNISPNPGQQIQMEADKFGSKGTGKGQGNRVAGLDSEGKIQAGRRQKKTNKKKQPKKNALKTKEGNKHLPTEVARMSPFHIIKPLKR